jgi:hypothetical protein
MRARACVAGARPSLRPAGRRGSRPARRRHSQTLPGVLGALALFAWAGCEVLVDGKLTDVQCAAEGAVGPPACPVGTACKQGACTPLELGLPCTTDADCWPGDLCLDPLPFGDVGPKTCSRPCCTSNDCDPDTGFVCWAPPTGGGPFCRSAGDLGRTLTGASRAWDACAKDADCRSGLCDLDALRCADTCCSDTSCTGLVGACRFDAAPGGGDGPGFFCATPVPGGEPRYEPCEQDSDCASGLCVEQMEQLRCSSPCCSSSMCETGPDKAEPVRCMTVLHHGASVRACGEELAPSATGPVGSGCAVDADCRGGACVSGTCTDACCSDASCGDPAAFGCGLTKDSASSALQCVPK